MTIIDHRILIPAAPDVVWDYISDITHNPDWQVDCRDVIFLTSRREGPGVRWRYAAPNGHEYVIAVTAWYNGLGYEYYLVDGAPYRENKGRIRLQEIPEGTIVQWTFTYELGGLFGGMRNALGLSRQVDQTIAESLKTLWQKIKQSGAASRPHEAKSLMRDAPNVDARSAYQPRHPSHGDRPETQKPVTAPTPAPTPASVSKFQPEPPITEGDGQPISVIAEPPIKQDDTRPRPAVTVPAMEPVVPPDIEGEPDFLDRATDLSRFEPPRDPSDTQPRKSVTPTESAAPAPAAMVEPEVPEAESPFAPPRTPPPPPPPPQTPMRKTTEETEPLGIPLPEVLSAYQPPRVQEPERQPEPETPAAPLIETVGETRPQIENAEPEQAKPASVESTPGPPAPVVAEPISEAPPPAPVMAEPATETPPPKPTGEMASIWEVFGVPRPSETQESAVIKVESSLVPTEMTAPMAAPDLEPDDNMIQDSALIRATFPRGSTRVGLRVALRRKLVHVRRP